MERRDLDPAAEYSARKPDADMVTVPQHHDGIGNALRSAFVPPVIPDDWVRLLTRLH